MNDRSSSSSTSGSSSSGSSTAAVVLCIWYCSVKFTKQISCDILIYIKKNALIWKLLSDNSNKNSNEIEMLFDLFLALISHEGIYQGKMRNYFKSKGWIDIHTHTPL